MKRDSLNENFWNNRYLDNDTGWDLGQYPQQLKNGLILKK